MLFAQDDAGYLDWLRANPSGLVLNVRAHPDPGYVVLHRASCGTISRQQADPLAYTGNAYRKIVGLHADQLHAAALAQGRSDGSFSKRCGLCRP